MELQLSQVWLQGEAETINGMDIRTTYMDKDMAALEHKLCEYVGVPHCITVESATTGLLLALRAVGVGAGDIVLCTSFSYFATVEIIRLAGATPMLVDINPNTFNIDPYCLDYVVGRCLRAHQPIPKALIAADLFGLPCNYEKLEEICEKHGIQLIEDMAQSFGAAYRERRAGGFGRMAVASFYPSKPVDELGEGGAVFCHDPDDARKLESLRRKIRMGRGDGSRGRGGFLDTVQASIVAERLEMFDFELECRREAAAQYRRRLKDVLKLQQVGEEYESAYTHFVVSLPGPEARDAVIERLRETRVPCQVFHPSPLPRREEAVDWGKVALVNAKSVSKKILGLPIHPYLSRRVVDHICDQIIEALEAFGAEGSSLGVEKSHST